MCVSWIYTNCCCSCYPNKVTTFIFCAFSEIFLSHMYLLYKMYFFVSHFCLVSGIDIITCCTINVLFIFLFFRLAVYIYAIYGFSWILQLNYSQFLLFANYYDLIQNNINQTYAIVVQKLLLIISLCFVSGYNTVYHYDINKINSTLKRYKVTNQGFNWNGAF